MSLVGRSLSLFAQRYCARRYASRVSPVAARPSTVLPMPRLDYRSLCENIEEKTRNIINRKAAVHPDVVAQVAQAYEDFKRISNDLNAKRHARSAVGDRIRQSAAAGDMETKRLATEEASSLKTEITQLEVQLSDIEGTLLSLALPIPNDTHSATPIGPESSAVTLGTHGPNPILTDPKRDHVDICRTFGLLDLESAATVTGSSWYYLLNEAASLEIALTNYAISVAVQNGFTPVVTPDVVRSDIASRCGFQPRDFSDPPIAQMYHIKPMSSGHSHSPELVLSGTAEIPLAGMFANKVFPEATLPMKVVGIGHAFRAESGARGADTRGLYRVHQFTKVELFSVTTKEASEHMMDEMARVQKAILDGLGLPFRVLDMPTEELGASAYRKFDMEAWMPGRGGWGEVTSLSNCTDYQARRLHIRYRPAETRTETSEAPTGLPFAHTLNGTAAAIPRLIVALLENGAFFDERNTLAGIHLPRTLKPHWIAAQDQNLIQWINP